MSSDTRKGAMLPTPSKMALVRELTDYPEDLRRHLADIIKTVRNRAVELDSVALLNIHEVLSNLEPHHSLEHEAALLSGGIERLIAGATAGRNRQYHELQVLGGTRR